MDDCYNFGKSVTDATRTNRSTSWPYWVLTLLVGVFMTTQSYAGNANEICGNGDCVGSGAMQMGHSGMEHGGHDTTGVDLLHSFFVANVDMQGKVDTNSNVNKFTLTMLNVPNGGDIIFENGTEMRSYKGYVRFDMKFMGHGAYEILVTDSVYGDSSIAYIMADTAYVPQGGNGGGNGGGCYVDVSWHSNADGSFKAEVYANVDQNDAIDTEIITVVDTNGNFVMDVQNPDTVHIDAQYYGIPLVFKVDLTTTGGCSSSMTSGWFIANDGGNGGHGGSGQDCIANFGMDPMHNAGWLMFHNYAEIHINGDKQASNNMEIRLAHNDSLLATFSLSHNGSGDSVYIDPALFNEEWRFINALATDSGCIDTSFHTDCIGCGGHGGTGDDKGGECYVSAGWDWWLDDNDHKVLYANAWEHHWPYYKWTVTGMQHTAHGPNPGSIAFPQDGQYEITLIVGDTADNCLDTVSKMVMIQAPSECKADLDIDWGKSNGFHVEFFNRSQIPGAGGAMNFTFTFTDEQGNVVADTSSSDPNFHFPIDFPADTGKYHVTVTSMVGGCTDTMSSEANGEDGLWLPIMHDDGDFSGQGNCELAVTNFIATQDTTEDFLVDFVVSVDGSYTNIWWGFDDGSGTEEANPSHHFPHGGFFHVCVSVQDTLTGCFAEKCLPVQVDGAAGDKGPGGNCFAQFSASADSTYGITFTNTSQGDATEYVWRFDDGTDSVTTSTDAIHHVYENPGYYWVCISSFDSASGCHNEYCEQVAIEDANSGHVACNAYFTTFLDVENKTVTLTNDSKGNISSFYWDFGDNNFSEETNPEHTYEELGYYEITLSTFDSTTGCQGWHHEVVELLDSATVACKAVMGGHPDFETLTIHFNNESKGEYTNVLWEFGDGETSEEFNPSHQFEEFGFMHITLTIFDTVSGCQDRVEEHFELREEGQAACFANFTFYPEVETKTIHFTNESEGDITSFWWDFGDGNGSDEENPSHQYEHGGFFHVELSVFDSVSGCQNFFHMGVELFDSNKVSCFAEFTAFPEVETKTVHFTNASKGQFTDFWWEFGDGNTSQEENPSHVYHEHGFYHVGMSVHDSVSGCHAHFDMPIQLLDSNTVACFAEFTWYPDVEKNTVHFTNESKGNFTNFHWRFGDGNDSKDENPSHEYAEKGFYHVELNVFDSVSGCNAHFHQPVELIDSNTVACYANYTVHADVATKTVYFTNSSEGNFTDYYWDFGDGNNSSEESPTHVYEEYGYYEVCLTVYDSVSGCQGFFCDAGELVDGNTAACFADFTFYPDPQDKKVYFESTGKGNITEYFWDFGDGNNSGEEHPVHTYDELGFYGVTLVVFDSVSNCHSEVHQPVELMDSNAVSCFAEFSLFIDFATNTVTFNNESQGNFTDYYWEFGDGNISDEASPTHTYDGPGYYHVGMSVFDSVTGCQRWIDRPLELVDANDTTGGHHGGHCFAEFGFYPELDAMTVHFENKSKGNYSKVFWDFGDGNFSEDHDPSHMYDEQGFYGVTLVVHDEQTGCQAEYHHPVELIDFNDTTGGPVGGHCFAEYSVFVDLATKTVTFNNESEGNISEYYWELGDGNVSHDESPTHTYAEYGYYEVCLTVFDSTTGCQAHVCHAGEIVDTNTVACFAEFTAYPDLTTNTVHFTNTSKGQFTDYHWDFGDGNYSKDESPSHVYAEQGYFGIHLGVYDSVSGCFAEFYEEVELIDTNTVACLAEFTVFPDVATKTATFSNTSKGDISKYFWNFGDGSFSTEENPTKVYAEEGYYDIELMVFDHSTGCQSEFWQPLELVDTNSVACLAKFSEWKDVATLEVKFTNESEGDYNKIFWNFGDGKFSQEENPVHVYAEEGYYEVQLTILDLASGCQSEFWAPVELIDTNTVACLADFSFYPDLTTKTAHFTNESKGEISNYFWSFGDGKFSQEENPSHTYGQDGYYGVELTVFDVATGCQESIFEEVEMIDTNSVACLADFTLFPDVTTREVKFSNTSQGNISKQFWSFGDGAFSTEESPSHTYAQQGYYGVELTVFDVTTGCQEQTFQEVELVDTNAIACVSNFSFYPDVTTMKVHFTNESQGNISNYHWNFGDGSFSGDTSPVHTYANQGFYRVELTVFDASTGCQEYSFDAVTLIDTTTVSCNADFSYFPDLASKTAEFSNNSEGTYNKVFWRFGDGNFSKEMNPSHTYANDGFYRVELTVFDSVSGCQSTAFKAVEMIDTTRIVCFANFTFFPDATTGKVDFSNTSDGDFTDYHWSFGDGNYSDEESPSHTYAKDGFYKVELTVFDANSGCQAYFHDAVQLIDTTTVSCFAEFDYMPEDRDVHFTDISQGTFDKFYWIFGDGSISTDQNPTHTYNNDGVYKVVLTVFDEASGCTDRYEDIVEIFVDTAEVFCQADFSFYPDETGTVQFTNLSLGTYTDVHWDFGNGNFSNSDTTASNTYGVFGYYEACLTVFDATSGCMHTVCTEVVAGTDDAATTNCQAKFEYFPNGATVDFTDKSLGGYSQVFFDFGDGTNSTDTMPSHTFDGSGYYEVCLTVFDTTTNCFDSYCEFVSVIDTTTSADDNCQAFFTYFPKGNGDIKFQDESFGQPKEWYWNFGDGTPAGDQKNPTHTYAADGYYEVCLTSTNDAGCQETFCDVIAVGDVSNSCYANYNYYADSVTATGIFNNLSLGEDLTYAWDFGDSSVISAIENPRHVYPGVGYYAVCLTVSNAAGCEDIYCNDINIGNDLADKCLFSCVWPGDANGDLEANHYDLLTIGLNYGHSGPARDSVSILGDRGHFAEDWSTFQTNGTNNKHADCDGNGIVELIDTAAIHRNFGTSHFAQYRKGSRAAADLTMAVSGTIEAGAAITVDVSTDEDIDLAMYGIGFELGFQDGDIDYNSFVVDWTDSWLGDEGVDMIGFNMPEEAKDRLNVSVTGIDQMDRNGSGHIATITFNLSGTFSGSNLDISLNTSAAVDANGDTVVLESTHATYVAEASKETTFTVEEIKVFPNPSNGEIFFNLPLGEFEVMIINNVGQVVYTESNNTGGRVEIDASELSNGIYTIQINSNDSRYQSTISIVH